MGLRVGSVKDKVIVVRTGIVGDYSEYGAPNVVLDDAAEQYSPDSFWCKLAVGYL